MPVLEELYVSFNDVRELSPLLTHEALHVLDLEGNLIEDFNEVKALKAVPTLREINLSLNPFLKSGNLSRADVLNDLPQIEVLDDLPRDSTEEEEEPVEFTQSALPLEELLNNSPAYLDCSSPLEWVAGAGVSGHLGSNPDSTGDQESRALQDLLRRAGRPIGAPPTPQHHAPVAASAASASVDSLATALTNDDLKAAPPRPPSARPSSAPKPPPEDVSGERGERRSSGLKGRAASWACLAGSGENSGLAPNSRGEPSGPPSGSGELRKSRSGARLEKASSLFSKGALSEKALAPLEKELAPLKGGRAADRSDRETCQRGGATGFETPFGAGAGGLPSRNEGKKKSKSASGSGGAQSIGDLHSWAASLTSAAPAVASLAGAGKAKAEKPRTPAVSSAPAATGAVPQEAMARADTSAAQGSAQSSVGSAPGGSAGAAGGADVAAADGGATPSSSSAAGTRGSHNEVLSQAIAEWRAGRSVQMEVVEKAQRTFEEEPNEQDLVVEGLKRAPRPVPSLFAFATSRTATDEGGGNRLGFGFLPDRRGLRTAWSSSASASTLYRPTSASTCTSSGASAGWSVVQTESEVAASDLTLGDEALVGNPLAAVRRRRRHDARANIANGPSGPGSSGSDKEESRRRSEEELGIRNLLRNHESTGQETCPTPTIPAPARLMTPDVRIRTLTRPLPADGALPQRISTSASSKERPASTTATLFADDLPSEALEAPSFATASGEVLLIE